MMKKLLLTILCLCFTVHAVAATVGFTAVGGESYEDITIFWDMENSSTLNLPIGFTGSSSGYDPPTYDSVNFVTGSYSMDRFGAYRVVYFNGLADYLSHDAGQMAIWFRLESETVSSSVLIVKESYGGSNDDCMYFELTSSKTVIFSHVGDNPWKKVSLTSSALTTGSWYYLVGYWDKAATDTDTLRFTIYNSSGTALESLSSTTSLGNQTAEMTDVWFGSGSTNATAFQIDHYVHSSDVTRDMWGINDITDFN